MSFESISLYAGVLAAFGVVWLFRRTQLRHIHAQGVYYNYVARKVRELRLSPDLPPTIREFVEDIVSDPLDGAVVRHIIWEAFRRSSPNPRRHVSPKTEELVAAFRSMSPEDRTALGNIMFAYLMAQSHATLVAGYFFRKLRMSHLERNTEAEVALETAARRYQSLHLTPALGV